MTPTGGSLSVVRADIVEWLIGDRVSTVNSRISRLLLRQEPLSWTTGRVTHLLHTPDGCGQLYYLQDCATKLVSGFQTRWLYCVECPQYSTRLEALGYLCDCVSGRLQSQPVVKVICHKAHCCRRWVVQCYLTGDSNVTCPPMRAHWRHLANTIELVHSSAHSSPQPKWQMDRFSHFCRAYGTKCLFFTMGAPIHQNCPLPCNTWCFGPMRAHNRNGTSIGSAVFAQMTAKCPYMVCPFRPQNCSFPYWHLDLM